MRNVVSRWMLIMGVLLFAGLHAQGAIPIWAQDSEKVEPDVLARLIRELGHPSPRVRERAEARLLQLGPGVVGDALRRAARNARDYEAQVRAVQILEQFDAPDDKAFAAAHEQAQEAFAKGDFHMMVGLYMNLARRHTKDRGVWLQLGHALRMTGDYAKAVDCYLLVRESMLEDGLEPPPKRDHNESLPTQHNVLVLTDAVARIQRQLLGQPADAIGTCQTLLDLKPLVRQTSLDHQRAYARDLADNDKHDEHRHELWPTAAVLAQLGFAQAETGRLSEAVVSLARFRALQKRYQVHYIHHLRDATMDVIRATYPRLPQPLAAEDLAGFILLTPEHPSITIDMQGGERFLHADQTLSNGSQKFLLLAPPGMMFERLACSIDNEQHHVRYGGHFHAESEHGAGLDRFTVPLGDLHWDRHKPGRARLSTLLEPVPGTTMVVIRCGSWPARRDEPARFTVHDLQIEARFLALPDELPPIQDRSEGRIQNGVYGYDQSRIRLTVDGEQTPPFSASSFLPGEHVYELTDEGGGKHALTVFVESSSREGITFSKGCPFDRRMTRLFNAAHCSPTRLPDDSYLIAFETQGPIDRAIGLARSTDLVEFPERWAYQHDTFNSEKSPALLCDSQGVVWMMYASDRLSLQPNDSAAYRLWITRSQDFGVTWATPECVQVRDVRFHQHGDGDTPFQLKEYPRGAGYVATVGSKILKGDRPDRLETLMDVADRYSTLATIEYVVLAEDEGTGKLHALLVGQHPDKEVHHVADILKPGATVSSRLPVKLPNEITSFVHFAARDDRLVLFFAKDNATQTCGIDLRQPDRFALEPMVYLGITDHSPRFFPELTPEDRVRILCGPGRMGTHSWLLEAPFERWFADRASSATP